MRVFRQRSLACERVRQAASLRLDGELSQLETALLDRHLKRCAPCAGFAADLSMMTDALRSAPLVALEQPIALPLRRRLAFGTRNAGAWIAAASAAAAALLAVMMLPADRVHGGPVTPVPRVVPSNNEDLRDLRALRRSQLKPNALLLARALPPGPEIY